MKKLWKVGDLAKMTGLTVRTMRFYDQIGLFSPSGQTESGHRLYNKSDLSRLHQILTLKELGLSLEEIKLTLDEGKISPLEIISLQKTRLKEQIKLQQKLLEQLEHVSKRMRGQTSLFVDDFTNLLQAMKMEFEKPVIERRIGWERSLGALGNFFADENERPNSKEENS